MALQLRRLGITAFAILICGQLPAVADEREKVKFSEEYLADETAFALGKDLWQQQCRHCHGANAYPGKAPKLKPRKYKPDFVFDRITDGFRKMPPWKDVYSLKQRKALVAFIMNRKFRP